MRPCLFAVFLSALPIPASAQTYQAINLLNVIPVDSSSFEVIEDNSEGARGIWCAAAGFAEDRLGANGPAELYVKRGRGPSVSLPGRKGVVFTLQASQLNDPVIKSYSVTVDQPGLSLPVGHAIQFCKDYLIELNDL